MNPSSTDHSPTWIGFTYAMFAASMVMVSLGIVLMPTDLGVKAYLAMGVAMLVQSCLTMAKTVRDAQERTRLVNRLEDAKAERLLMEIDRSK